MKTKKVKISGLKPHPKNPNTHPVSIDTRDGCRAECPECMWGGKFPAKDYCEGYEYENRKY